MEEPQAHILREGMALKTKWQIMSLGKQETNNKTNKTQRSTTELGVFQVASL